VQIRLEMNRTMCYKWVSGFTWKTDIQAMVKKVALMMYLRADVKIAIGKLGI